jgi:hypothetical protein
MLPYPKRQNKKTALRRRELYQLKREGRVFIGLLERLLGWLTCITVMA